MQLLQDGFHGTSHHIRMSGTTKETEGVMPRASVSFIGKTRAVPRLPSHPYGFSRRSGSHLTTHAVTARAGEGRRPFSVSISPSSGV